MQLLDKESLWHVYYIQKYENTFSIFHHFNPLGTFNMVVRCENRLYSTNATTTVHAYDPITPFRVTLSGRCPGDSEGQTGMGVDRNIFRLSCDVVFETSDQFGSNVSYLYSFG